MEKLRSDVKMCCGGLSERNVVEKFRTKVVQRSVGEECCNSVL